MELKLIRAVQRFLPWSGFMLYTYLWISSWYPNRYRLKYDNFFSFLTLWAIVAYLVNHMRLYGAGYEFNWPHQLWGKTCFSAGEMLFHSHAT